MVMTDARKSRISQVTNLVTCELTMICSDNHSVIPTTFGYLVFLRCKFGRHGI